MQPAALCQGRADVKLTNTGESSQSRTVSGDVLSDPTLEAPVPKGICEKGDRHLLQRAHSSCTERVSQAELVALRVSEDDPADI